MNKILFVDCCARRNSRTKILAERLLSHLDGEITRLELYSEDIKPIDADGIARRDKGDCDILKYARQLSDADEVVVAAPYWDLSFPSLLKVWLEQTSVVGVTFTYDEQGVPVGLCRAKRAYYVTTAGGPIFDRSFGSGYVKALFSMFGINEFHEFSAENLDVEGADTEKILTEAKDKIDASFKKPNEDGHRNFLFLKQTKTLDTLKEHGAISDAQYDISYNGLVTKMHITQNELKEWTEKK